MWVIALHVPTHSDDGINLYTCTLMNQSLTQQEIQADHLSVPGKKCSNVILLLTYMYMYITLYQWTNCQNLQVKI